MTKRATCRNKRLFLGQARADMVVISDDLMFSPVTHRGTAKCPDCKRWMALIVREFEEDKRKWYDLYLPPHKKGV